MAFIPILVLHKSYILSLHNKRSILIALGCLSIVTNFTNTKVYAPSNYPSVFFVWAGISHIFEVAVHGGP